MKHRRTSLFLAMLWLLATPLGCILPQGISPAQAYTIEEDFYRLVEDYPSPHISWAKPYAGGKIKALFIVPRGTAREVIEVAQRLSLDYTVVMTLSDAELGWTAQSSPYARAEGISYEEMVRETAEKLKAPYDVIITGHLQWNMFPPQILYTLLEKVHHGTGWVHSYADYGQNDWIRQVFAKPKVEEKFVSLGVPWQALPVWRERGLDKLLELREWHQGRMALLFHGDRPRFQFLTPRPSDLDASYRELHYEYYQSLAIKAILWAARREPKVRFTSIGIGTERISRSALLKTPLRAELQGSVEGLSARMVLRDEDKRLFADTTLPVKGSHLSFALPVVPAGRYFADVWLRSRAGIVNWASSAFEVTSDPAIASVALEKTSYRPGEVVRAIVTLAGKVPARASLELRVVDNLGRLVVRKVQPCLSAKQTLSFRVSNPLALSAEVQVNLRLGAEVVARGSTTLYVPLKRTRGQFAHAVWAADSCGNEFVRRLMIRQLRACGVDLQTNSSRSAQIQAWSARNNFDTIPYATRYFYEGKDLVRSPCLTDPKFLQEHLAALEQNAREMAPYGPRGYTLGDECYLAGSGVDVCFSPTCTSDLRQWLRTEYPSVEALNQSWGTRYRSFDEAEPITLEDARRLNQPARWIDHRRHMEAVYARMLARAREAIRRGDPGADVGFDGPLGTHSWSGNDWWRLMQIFDLCTVYDHPEEWEPVRSFAKPGALLGVWYGGYFNHRTEDQERMWPWRALLNGFNSTWWYAVYHGLTTCPMDALTPSMTLYPAFRWANEELAEIRSSIAAALMHAKRLHDGIATHYSQSSLHASTWDGSFGNLRTVWAHLYGVLEDMGFQWNCRAYAQIERRGMDPQEYPVFILPYSQAISPAEAAALRRYVEAGGLLIADVRPGVCDHHGKPVNPGLLDDLFGIRRTPGKGVVRNVTGKVEGAFERLTIKGTTLPGLDVDGEVQVDGGTALGSAEGIPIVIVKRTGKGLAALLNYGISAAYRVRREEAALSHWRVLLALMAWKGVRPPCQVTTVKGPARMVEVVRYQDGPVTYYGFLKYRTDPSEEATTATISAPRRAHTYNVRTGEYLGETSSWRVKLVPARALLFAQVPYRVQGVQLKTTLQPSAADGSHGPLLTCALTLVTKATLPGRHWVHLRVFGPEGRERPHYARNVALVEGAGRVAIPLALNDSPGTWRLVARDVMSGCNAVGTFTVGGSR